MRRQSALLLILLIGVAIASLGDRLVVFHECLERCKSDQCGVDAKPLPLNLRLLFWDCPQNCDYQCQQITTNQRIDEDLEVVQYHGKWPFVRLYGIQEPASVLFSVLNFIPHYEGLRMLLNKHTKESGNEVYMRKYYIVFALIGMNAWVWSSVFHTRDFLLTERLDYFSAGLTILYGFYTATIRIFRLDLPQKRLIRNALTIFCVAVYCCHVGYLQFIRFSYTYNMAFGVVVGLIQNFLWSYHAFSTYAEIGKLQREGKLPAAAARSWALWPFYIVTAISAGMAFELFDFAPMAFILDAHALWHAATVIPTYWWYWYMNKDMIYLKSIKSK